MAMHPLRPTGLRWEQIEGPIAKWGGPAQARVTVIEVSLKRGEDGLPDWAAPRVETTVFPAGR